jgi:hypothetical protein
MGHIGAPPLVFPKSAQSLLNEWLLEAAFFGVWKPLKRLGLQDSVRSLLVRCAN